MDKGFSVNADSKSVVFRSGIDPDLAIPPPSTHYRVKNNGNTTFHVFPLDSTTEPIAQGKEANIKSTCH